MTALLWDPSWLAEIIAFSAVVVLKAQKLARRIPYFGRHFWSGSGSQGVFSEVIVSLPRSHVHCMVNPSPQIWLTWQTRDSLPGAWFLTAEFQPVAVLPPPVNEMVGGRKSQVCWVRPPPNFKLATQFLFRCFFSNGSCTVLSLARLMFQKRTSVNRVLWDSSGWEFLNLARSHTYLKYTVLF